MDKNLALTLVKVTIDCFGVENLKDSPNTEKGGRPFFLTEDQNYKLKIGDFSKSY